ncbi:MAG: SH3 domain-containing protein [Phenylobacterium sp.]
MRKASRQGLLKIAAALAAATATAALAADRATPSGLPVPRYVSLKFGEVNARLGPGDDYRALWIYRVKGLPVQVVEETREWRKVCDPEGRTAWVHKRVTDGRRMVMRVRTGPAPLRRKPEAAAQPFAYLSARALASLDRCTEGWCRVKAGSATGWTPAGELWGTDERPQCR